MKTRIIIAFILFQGCVLAYAQEYNKDIKEPEKKTKPKKIKLFPPTYSENSEKENNTSLTPRYKEVDEVESFEQNKPIVLDISENRKKNFFDSPYAKFIVPTIFISYGVLAQSNKAVQRLDQITGHEVNEHIDKKTPVDDLLQYTPIVAVYALGLAGVKAKHNFRDRTLIAGTSYLIMGVTVQTMKKTIHVERPNGSDKQSFPSGHAATAFTGAHILFKEYKDVSPWIGVAGYATATATGTMRVINKKHWVSDVVTGAGIAILSVELGYLLLPVWHNILGIKEQHKSLVVVPTVSIQQIGVGMAYTF